MQKIWICTPKSTRHTFANVSTRDILRAIRILYVTNQMDHTEHARKGESHSQWKSQQFWTWKWEKISDKKMEIGDNYGELKG